jgi:hypothetical protein
MINIYLALGLFCRVATVVILCGSIIPRQIHEVRRVKDGFTNLRYFVLAWLIFFLLASIPVIAYQYITLNAEGHTFLQNFATLSSGVANLAVGIVLILIYNYKYED